MATRPRSLGRRFITAATRAGQLLLGSGGRDDVDRAEAVAGRAIEIDPWADGAHGVLIAAALQQGDRARARRRLEHCMAALHDLDLEPSFVVQHLQRRLGSIDA